MRRPPRPPSYGTYAIRNDRPVVDPDNWNILLLGVDEVVRRRSLPDSDQVTTTVTHNRSVLDAECQLRARYVRYVRFNGLTYYIDHFSSQRDPLPTSHTPPEYIYFNHGDQVLLAQQVLPDGSVVHRDPPSTFVPFEFLPDRGVIIQDDRNGHCIWRVPLIGPLIGGRVLQMYVVGCSTSTIDAETAIIQNRLGIKIVRYSCEHSIGHVSGSTGCGFSGYGS